MDKREAFTIFEDSSGEGVRLIKRVEFDAVDTDAHIAGFVAKNIDDEYALIQLREKGAAVSGVLEMPVLPGEDSSGNLSTVSVRSAGQASGSVQALPGLVAIDPSSNYAYLKLNADGELLISNEPLGVKKAATGKVTGVLNTATEIVSLTLTASKVYEKLQYRGSCAFACAWELYKSDNAVETLLDQFMTGPGQFTLGFKPEWLEHTAGATGVQKLILKATQYVGSASDCRAYLEAFEKA